MVVAGEAATDVEVEAGAATTLEEEEVSSEET